MSETGDIISGHVISWNSAEGWGVLASEALPARVWGHFSAIAGEGYRELDEGETVSFTWESAEQDGYHFRAVMVYRDGGSRAAAARSGYSRANEAGQE